MHLADRVSGELKCERLLPCLAETAFPIAKGAKPAEIAAVKAARFTFNDLRSKSATDTKDLAEASARLGHTSTTVTKRHYVRKPS